MTTTPFDRSKGESEEMAKANTNTAAAPAVHAPSKAKHVIVASKLPMSIEIQLCKGQERVQSGQHGSVKETVHVKVGQSYVIRGTAYPQGTPPKGFPKPGEAIEDDKGGYVLTRGVPAEFWDEWVKQNAETEMVRNGLIKAQPDIESLMADAAEHAHQDSGLGPLNPDQDEKGRPLDRRAPRPMNSSVSAVGKAVAA